ncbi:type II secretion system protein GspC [Marinobacterium jannaschii]|uniref:type II secretion system protein GspC n=1 Tax=Marinobacterium jannaschii TaxID=64970 RepID=UPI00048752F2|nr:type II secretion system protein GspC [Marinobacterium jannaschii]
MLIQRSIQLTTLALTLLLAAMAAKWTWQLVALSHPAPLSLSQPDTSVATGTAVSPSYDLSAIINGALFGKAAEKPVTRVVQAPPKQAQASRSRLQLIGVIGGSKGAAIVRNGSKQNTYLVGEFMNKDQSLQLVSVASDHAILLRNGVPERLTLVGSRKPSRINTARPARPDETSRDVDLNESRFRRLIGDARQTLATNPLRLTRFMNIRPVQKNGKLQGYSINSGQDRRLFQALGLQTGDLISSINGRAVSDMQLPDVYASLQQQDSVQIEIIRNGTPLQFNLQF